MESKEMFGVIMTTLKSRSGAIRSISVNPCALLCTSAHTLLHTHTRSFTIQNIFKMPKEEQRLTPSFELGNSPHNMFAVCVDLMKRACTQAKILCHWGCVSPRCRALPVNCAGVKQGGKMIGQDSALAGINDCNIMLPEVPSH